MNPPPPSTNDERLLVTKILKAALETIASVTGQNTEIVVHDLTTPERSVTAIVNGHITGRTVGSPLIAGPNHDRGFAAALPPIEGKINNEPVIISNYPTTGRNGTTLRSSTAVFRDAAGIPFASLCINADLSGLTAAHACLTQLLSPAHHQDNVIAEEPDMAVLMAEIIQAALRNTRGMMNRKAKLEAVQQMQERGIFIVKGGVEKAAAALGVTRYTIYNYLNAIQAMSTPSRMNDTP